MVEKSISWHLDDIIYTLDSFIVASVCSLSVPTLDDSPVTSVGLLTDPTLNDSSVASVGQLTVSVHNVVILI